MTLKPGDARLVYSDGAQIADFWFVEADGSHTRRHRWEARNAAVGNPSPDPYGHDCPMPFGDGYVFGKPMGCGPDSDDGIAYGYWAIPINDDPARDFAAHGRDGIMAHGGGSASPTPFAAKQGWYATCGCLRLQNEDLGMAIPAAGTLVNAVNHVQSNGGTVYFSKVA
jgi:hypothetical protein